MAKYLEVAEILRNRIAHGDYVNTPMPGERKVAEEIGVSYMTARKAIRYLIDAGVVAKDEDGKAQPPKPTARFGNCAFLAPAFASLQTIRWQMALDRTLSREGRILRTVYFMHWDDPAIVETAANFDMVFLLPKLGNPPERLQAKLRGIGTPVVILEADWVERGFLSLISQPLSGVTRLLNHLTDGGRRPVDCFNTQPHDEIIDARLRAWERMENRGRLVNYPVDFYGDTLAHTVAVASQLLRRGEWRPRAVFCTTLSAAIGLNRVFADFGVRVGDDVWLAAFNGEDWAPYLTPSITTLANADLGMLINRALEQPEAAAPVCIQPPGLEIVYGESAPEIQPHKGNR